MSYIKLLVSCQISHRKETVYYYLSPTGQPMFNGCENQCGSTLCVECAKTHQKEAEESLLTDLRFIDPMTLL